MLSSSRWIMNGGPSTCAGCGQPFPHKERRIEAQVGADGRLYWHDTTCEADIGRGNLDCNWSVFARQSLDYFTAEANRVTSD
jgi:hypothetical protein